MAAWTGVGVRAKDGGGCVGGGSGVGEAQRVEEIQTYLGHPYN